MAIRIRVSPRYRILDFILTRPWIYRVGVTRSQVAEALGISYWSARYWLEKMVEEKVIDKERIWIYRGVVFRWVYYPIIKVRRPVDVTIVIYSVSVGVKREKGYAYRFQAFYDVDAVRDEVTGEFDYGSELTRMEIEACLRDFRERWGWSEVGGPAKGTSVPEWVETSEFSFRDEPKGADCKLISQIEDEEEKYFKRLLEHIYPITDEEKEEFMAYVRGRR